MSTIDTVAHARNTDPETSHEAAGKVGVSHQRRVVLMCLLNAYPRALTDEMIYDNARYMFLIKDVTPQGLRSRRKSLIDEGYVEVAATDAQTSLGNRCRDYRLTREGVELCQSLNRS